MWTRFLARFGFHKDYFMEDDGFDCWRRYGPKWSTDIELAWPVRIRFYRSIR